MTKPNDFPALNGETVTEGHARVCRERGHATHTVDGEPMPRCPRCGELREPAEPAAPTHVAAFDTHTRALRVTRADGTVHRMGRTAPPLAARILDTGDTLVDALGVAGLALAPGASWAYMAGELVAPVVDSDAWQRETEARHAADARREADETAKMVDDTFADLRALNDAPHPDAPSVTRAEALNMLVDFATVACAEAGAAAPDGHTLRGMAASLLDARGYGA